MILIAQAASPVICEERSDDAIQRASEALLEAATRIRPRRQERFSIPLVDQEAVGRLAGRSAFHCLHREHFLAADTEKADESASIEWPTCAFPFSPAGEMELPAAITAVGKE